MPTMIPSVSASLRNQFLIATHCLETGIFKSSVTYICEHNEDGAMGIIINRPSSLSLQDILTDVCESHSATLNPIRNSSPVMVGGPVGLERGFVLHQLTDDEDASCWGSSLHVTSRIVLTGSKDILLAINEGRGPHNYLVFLGYAGWEAGQLEQELADNAWINTPANPTILFDTPFHQRANAAANLLGIDLASLATMTGTA